jgi:uncharacterized protein YjiS (DUF1127 family)
MTVAPAAMQYCIFIHCYSCRLRTDTACTKELPMQKFKSILATMRQNYIRNRTFAVLTRLDDRQLRDIGYERDNLWSTVKSIR